MDFSLLQILQPGLGAHPPSCFGFSREIKLSGPETDNVYHRTEVKMRGSVTWLPYVTSWREQEFFAIYTLSQSEKQSLSALSFYLMEHHKSSRRDFREVSRMEETHLVSGSYFPALSHGGQRPIAGQSIRDLYRTKWFCDRFAFEYFCFLISVSFR